MIELEYPFDSEYILKKKKSLKRLLLQEQGERVKKKIAVLGGSTTHDIVLVLELFLLNYGIEPQFYESEYNMYWQDGVFGNEELAGFAPDIVYIHTTNRNIVQKPTLRDSIADVDRKLAEELDRFTTLWDKVRENYHPVIIQNNMELPSYRLMGNRDFSDYRGYVNFVGRLNAGFAAYGQQHEDFYICDINYISACFGLDRWSDDFFYHMYKYALNLDAIPILAYNLANIVKSIYGKNKKAFVLDLDNTLWGGIVGDDGADNIQIGEETAIGQVYGEFQEYIRAHRDLGVLLTIDSKNEEANALEGLNRPDSVLRPEDFAAIEANWEPKSENIHKIAATLNLGEDSFVFVDDNPAEREIVRQNCHGIAIAAIDRPENYIKNIDRAGYFEATLLSVDDMDRNRMYMENARRVKLQSSFQDYGEYLDSLEMTADIAAFAPAFMSRIAQLTNKSNQFNLTTLRCSQEDIQAMADSDSYITLYGRLRDKFGDNGVVAVTAGEIMGRELHIRLWLMSCRVLKRDMELAMLDELVRKSLEAGIDRLVGYYYPTKKNGMVKDFYLTMGFDKIKEDSDGCYYELQLNSYEKRNSHISVERGQ